MFKVIINNRNRLTTTKKMVEDLLERDTKEIIIIDNESTYLTLLEWYNQIPNEVKVLRYHNEGHLALFGTGLVNQIQEDWCFYTDSDIQLNPNMPKDYQQIMLDYGLKYGIDKISLALQIDDLPDHYMFKQQVIRNEGRWWLDEVEPNVFRADTDTTFSLNKKVDQFQSLRIAGDFTSKHMPWYLDLDNIDEEEQYYLDHCADNKLTQYTKQHKIKKEL
jgi:glycosyltransferase involved in cell wall biosynthesis